MESIKKYLTVDGHKYWISRMRKDDVDSALIAEAERYNAEEDKKLAQIQANMEAARLPHRPWREEWTERDGTAE